MRYSDVHIHTKYCHGEGTPREIVEQAMKQKLLSVGILGHAQMEFFCDYAMTPKAEAELFELVNTLKVEYKGILPIFSGIEQDYYSIPLQHPYDYVIGSVHYIRPMGQVVSVDSDPAIVKDAVRTYYNSDVRKLYEDYYSHVANVIDKTGADIVGHFDLITKFQEQTPLFSEDDPAYIRAALTAIETLMKHDPIFEINSGAISRGYRTTPYPSLTLLKELKRLGARITLSSDAHTPKNIVYRFDESVALAKHAGFRSIWMMTEKGFDEYPIE